MKNSVKLAVAVLAMMAPSFAHATVHEIDFYFTSTAGVTALGDFMFGANNQITSIGGVVSNTTLGGTITGIIGNPNFSNISYSPDGRFYYDNMYTPGDPVLDVAGILFTTSNNPGGYWNLWGNGPGSYSLYASNSSGYPVAEVGTLSVPELSTWMMMVAGFAALGFAGHRRQKAALAD